MDAVQNFAVGVVAAGYDENAIAIDLVPGYVSRFPVAPFYVVWWNVTDFPGVWDDPNREIVRVTAITGDTLSITRGQENTTAIDHDSAGKQYLVSQDVTAALIAQLCALVGDPTLGGDLTGTVSAASIVPGVIVDSDVNAGAAIAQSKISTLVSDLALKAPLASPDLTGSPTAPTPAANDNTTRIATTEYVQTEITGIGGSDPAMVGDITGTASNNAIGAGVIVNADINSSAAIAYSKLSLTNGVVNADISNTAGIAQSKIATLSADLNLKANLASPTFTGVPAAPTAAAATNTTQIASTAFVQQENAAKAPLASPVFTGNPTGPTPAANDNDTSLATTAYVQSELTAYASDAVTFSSKNCTTQAADDNTTKLANCQWVQIELTAYASDVVTFTNKTFADLTITGAETVGSMLFEGATADAFETSLSVVDPTADRTVLLPDEDVELGFRRIPPTNISANYTFTLRDSGKMFIHPSADVSARNWTIPASGSVVWVAGDTISGSNQNGAGVLTIIITTDTMRWAGPGTTGSRTIAANGQFTLYYEGSGQWKISGSGIS